MYGNQANWKETSRLERGGWERTGLGGHRALSVLWSRGIFAFRKKAWKLFWA